MPEVLCDVSPIQYLHQTGLLDLRRLRYGTITIPVAVAAELREGTLRGVDLPAFEALDWTKIRQRIPHRTLRSLSHYVTEPAGQRLAKTHLDVAATIYAALGLRILQEGKSRYYGAALEHLADARACYRASQDQGAWEELLAAVRRDHRRKTCFLASLDERLARAGPASPGSNAPASAGHRDRERPAPPAPSRGGLPGRGSRSGAVARREEGQVGARCQPVESGGHATGPSPPPCVRRRDGPAPASSRGRPPFCTGPRSVP